MLRFSPAGSERATCRERKVSHVQTDQPSHHNPADAEIDANGQAAADATDR